MKKIILSLMICIALIVGATGCRENTGTTETTPTTETTKTQSTPVSFDELNLNMR